MHLHTSLFIKYAIENLLIQTLLIYHRIINFFPFVM